MKQDRIQDLRLFDERIYDAIQDYLNNSDVYPSNAVLAINATTKEIMVDTPSACQNFNQYNLSSLIRKNEQGQNKPDCDETYELASQYFFVR